jgi:hypothetical protein
MKNFILGMLVVGLISATTISNNNITIKPATPKSTIVFAQVFARDAARDILKYVKQGYVVKSVTSAGTVTFLIVMEKY